MCKVYIIICIENINLTTTTTVTDGEGRSARGTPSHRHLTERDRNNSDFESAYALPPTSLLDPKPAAVGIASPPSAGTGSSSTRKKSYPTVTSTDYPAESGGKGLRGGMTSTATTAVTAATTSPRAGTVLHREYGSPGSLEEFTLDD